MRLSFSPETKNDANARPGQRRGRRAQLVCRGIAQERFEYTEPDPIHRNAAEDLPKFAEPDASLVGPADGAQKKRRHSAPVTGGRRTATAFSQ